MKKKTKKTPQTFLTKLCYNKSTQISKKRTHETMLSNDNGIMENVISILSVKTCTELQMKSDA